MSRQSTDSYTVVPAAPGFSVVQLLHNDDDHTFETLLTPVVAWHVFTSVDKESPEYAAAIPVLAGESLGDGRYAIKYPDGRVCFPDDGSSFKPGEDAAVLKELQRK